MKVRVSGNWLKKSGNGLPRSVGYHAGGLYQLYFADASRFCGGWARFRTGTSVPRNSPLASGVIVISLRVDRNLYLAGRRRDSIVLITPYCMR